MNFIYYNYKLLFNVINLIFCGKLLDFIDGILYVLMEMSYIYEG